MKLVYSTSNSLLVNHVRNLLEIAGVEALMKNQYLGGAAGDLPPTEAWPELWVEDADYARAQKVVDEFEQEPSPELWWRCPNCGERVEGQFAVCWNCGQPRSE